jgi:hypothetical protein
LIAGLAVWQIGKRPESGADGLAALVIFASTLACIYHSTYDALLLVVPWVAIVFGRLRGELPARLRPLVWSLLAIPAMNYLSTESVMARLNLSDEVRAGITAINSIAVLTTLLIAISLALRPRQTAAD